VCTALHTLPVVPKRRSSRGAVSAETAVVLPVLVAVTMGLVWVVGVAVTQIRVVDAARETARAAARDEPAATAVQWGRRVAPAGSHIDVQRSDGTVRVHVVAEVSGPGGIFRFLPALEVDARAVAASEQR
jgi:hypothetical protein